MANDIREGRWLCVSCGAECRGRDESCQGDGSGGCGAARPDGVRFYLPENSPYVTDPELIADAHSGADWICKSCNGANKGSSNGRLVISCVHCGRGRGSDAVPTELRNFAPGGAPSSASDLKAEADAARELLRDQARAKRGEGPLAGAAGRATAGRGYRIGAVVMCVVLVAALLWSFLATSPTISTISERTWAREIAIEKFVTLVKDGWSPPADARILKREIRQNGTEQVLVGHVPRTVHEMESYVSGSESYNCGTTDMGNGYFQDRTCERPTYSSRPTSRVVQDPVFQTRPVYDTWYHYEIDRWVLDRKLRSAGSDEDRVWPQVSGLRKDQRMGVRGETLSVKFLGKDGKTESKDVAETEWLKMDPGARIIANRNLWGTVRSLEIDGPAR